MKLRRLLFHVLIVTAALMLLGVFVFRISFGVSWPDALYMAFTAAGFGELDLLEIGRAHV